MMSEKTLERVMKVNDILAKKNAELEAENLELQKDRDIMSFKMQKLDIKARFVDNIFKDVISNLETKDSVVSGIYLSAAKFFHGYVKELKEEISK